ncbi:MAG: PH domain-containing protein [Acidobacteriota bacterium]|nr:PH domain-containing protein [Acidobacteriota bacterium]
MPVITCPDCGRDVSTMATACPHCGRPSPAGLTPIDSAPVPARKEETLWQGTPSMALLAGHFAGIVLVAVGVPLFTRFFAGTMPEGDGLVRTGWVITAIVLFIQVIALLVAWITLRSTMYRVTSQRVLVEQGVFSKKVDEIDLRYVDDSTFTQSLIERILGIGSVTLMSSDTSSPRYVLRSIKDPRGVREMIRAEAYQSSQRQVFTRVT